MGFNSKLNPEINFDIYSVGGEIISKNGIVMLNNWNIASMKVATVDPSVDFITLMPWDASQSSTSYSEVKLPLNESGSAHHTLRYMTNNTVNIYRNKKSSSTPYTWYVKYEGYDYVRSLSTSATTYELKAGKRTLTSNGAILQGNVTSSWSLDEFVKIGYEITNNGATVNMYLQLVGAGTYETAHTYYNQNAGTYVIRQLSDINSTTTAFVIDSTSTNGEKAFIDTTIHSTSDGSGDWRYKYKGRFTHHSNNNMYWCIEAEYNPRYVI